MSASLVGSEMCIRDRPRSPGAARAGPRRKGRLPRGLCVASMNVGSWYTNGRAALDAARELSLIHI
eukprot:12772295-Alexandrium_andersonii.AAC.1